MAVTWKINKCVYDLEKDSKTNVITKVYYAVYGGTGKGGKRGMVTLDTSDLSSFTEYSDLLESNIVTFVKATMGDEAVTALEAEVEALALENTTPTTGGGLPWS